jgi:hypothetical protein
LRNRSCDSLNRSTGLRWTDGELARSPFYDRGSTLFQGAHLHFLGLLSKITSGAIAGYASIICCSVPRSRRAARRRGRRSRGSRLGEGERSRRNVGANRRLICRHSAFTRRCKGWPRATVEVTDGEFPEGLEGSNPPSQIPPSPPARLSVADQMQQVVIAERTDSSSGIPGTII